MNLGFLKLSLVAVFLMSLASLGAIILLINPLNARLAYLIIFSTAVFLVLFSVFSWMGFYLRRKFVNENNQNHILKMSFRQSALVSLILISYLWLSHFGFLKIWTSLLLLGLALMIEYYFLVVRDKVTE